MCTPCRHITGIGDFFYISIKNDWRLNIPILTPTQAYAVQVEEINNKEHINFHEIYPILVALQRWGALFRRSRIIINTDNTNAFHSLQSNRLRGNIN